MHGLRHVVLLLLVLFSLEMRAEEQGWVLRAEDYAGDYTGAAMANGQMGILPWREPFSVRHVILNHVFEWSDRTGVNCVLRGINPFPIRLEVDGEPLSEEDITDWQQTIDLRRARHTTTFTARGKARITYSIVALRNLPYAGLVEVRIEALSPVKLAFHNRMDVPEGEYGTAEYSHQAFLVDGRPTKLLRTSAETSHGRYRVTAASMYHFEDQALIYKATDREMILSADLATGATTRFTLSGSICSSRDFSDPQSEAERQVVYIAHRTPEDILAGHERAWEKLWQSDIEIEGDEEAQRVVRFALFNLYGSVRAGSRLSIPPMGLSMQGYNGHVFWDAELWMYPPLMMLHPDLARSLVDYRTDRIAAARQRAQAYGYEGVMFPWESDWYGEESTPSWAITGPLEHHITADVGIAAWNYYCTTRDKAWLRAEGYPLLREIARFWESRVKRNADGTYSICGVVGADEYANNVVDNAFTNGAARRALEAAVKAAKVCGERAPEQWSEIARGLRFHVREGITQEYADYAGAMIKQADVNLLAYPLGIITDPEQIRRDMEYYDRKIDKEHGPAMTYGIFAVNYARMGQAEEAEQAFRKSYRPHVRPPFGVLAETPSSHNPYFTTCAGGVLQAVLSGFGGLEFTDKGIRQLRSVLPPTWQRLTIRGVGGRTYIVEQ